MGFIGWIVLGALAGWIASMIMGTNDKQGCLTDVVVGIIGAFVGGFLYSQLVGGEGQNGFIMSLVIAVVGACIVLAIKKAITGRR